MKKLLISTAAALAFVSTASYAHMDKMPATREEAIQYHQAKIDKLEAMTDAEYATWKKGKSVKTKSSHKSSSHSSHSTHVPHANMTDIGTEEEASQDAKHNATAK